jgi:hypothetical protein
MHSDLITRAAAPSAVTAAVIGIPADVYHFLIPGRAEEAGTVLFKLHGILLVAAFCLALVALVGIALRMGERAGRAGTAGTVLAFVGTVLVVGNIATEAFWMPLAPEVLDDPTGYTLATIIVSFGIFALGWLLVGISVARSGLAATPAAVLLCLGAVVGFTPLPGAYILLLAGLATTAASLTREAPVRAGALQAA